MSDIALYDKNGKQIPLPEDWKNLTPETQENLVDWYNVVEESLDADDLQRLADLFNKHQIRFAECERCGDLCFEAEPKDWGQFQGTGVGMTEGIFGNDRLCGSCYSEMCTEAKRYGLEVSDG